MNQYEFMEAYGPAIGFVAGPLFLMVSMLLDHGVRRKRFYRRNASGLESFPSYRVKVFVRFSERIRRLVASVVGLIGLFLLAAGFLIWAHRLSV